MPDEELLYVKVPRELIEAALADLRKRFPEIGSSIQWGPFATPIDDRAAITINLVAIRPDEGEFSTTGIGPFRHSLEVILDGPFGVVRQADLFCNYFTPVIDVMSELGARFRGASFQVAKQGQEVSNAIKIDFEITED